MTDSQKFFAEQKGPLAYEMKVASRLGLTRDDIRALRQRHLKEGEHWIYEKRRVMLSGEGVELLRQKLALPEPPPKVPTQPAQPAAHPAPRQMLLLAAPFKGQLIVWGPTVNRHILDAYLPETDPKHPRAHVRVVVKSNKNFVRGMKITASHARDDIYELVGNCPRWRGKF